MRRNGEPLGFNYAYRDLLIAMLICFMAMVPLALMAKINSEAGVRPQGDIVISLYWAKGFNADVDLWLSAPDEREPIGYLNRDGRHCDLTRDDRGNTVDPTSRNMEMITCRNAAPGEYIVNAVDFSSYDNRFPIHVIVVVQNKAGDVLLRKEADLTFDGDEVTVVRFRLDDKKAIVPGSANQLPAHLYLAG